MGWYDVLHNCYIQKQAQQLCWVYQRAGITIVAGSNNDTMYTYNNYKNWYIAMIQLFDHSLAVQSYIRYFTYLLDTQPT